ncbi:MAG TPA: DUF802 domain-containing protein [Burkholderiaceae bacterium]|nr:DUF802 domain-containing protein [Burkholderiaceae bacterium]
MNRIVIAVAFAVGLVAVAWVGLGFVGSSWLALAMTAVIAGVYLLGAFELRQFRAATASLAAALADMPQPLADLGDWLQRVPASLRNAVRLRVEGERVALPGPALTPYLVGLLVMLGMLGTFLGMVVTFKGAVFALEGSTDLQAIRSALAEPIKGLGLSFGTSVAGVAASAMLGLLSAISRRERVDAARQLDSRIATVLRPFSLAHQRQESFKALQAQAQALPLVVDKLQSLMDGLERRSQQLGGQLLEQQAQFHREVGVAYTGLASAVGTSLKDSLAAGARAAGESIQPVVEAAMSEIARESLRSHQRVFEATQTQLSELSGAFGSTARSVSEGWTTALRTHADTSAQQLDRLDQALGAFAQTFEQRSGALLAQTEGLIGSRVEAEASWTQQQHERMDELAALWRTELGALRAQEAAHGEAAVARLGELQAALASHLATLGAALEAPMTRLLQTAAEVPQAAAEVIAQLRQEMTRLTERDNLALQERTGLVERISSLLQALDQASGAQRVAIESLVAQAASVLDQAGSRFSQTLEAQAGRAAGVASHVASSAVELASLGESFSHGVQLFSASNEKLVDGLQRVEGALQQSMARSDEQLAYYVAQAREVIDLSITAQQGLVQDLRRRDVKQSALPKESVG